MASAEAIRGTTLADFKIQGGPPGLLAGGWRGRKAAGPQVVEVAACIVRRADGRVLMARRTAGQISPGFWELPGGKVDPGETAQAAAVRELAEEVGLAAQAPRPWIAYDHAFPLRRVRLNTFLVDLWSGEARGREGQQIAWVDPAAPDVAPLLPSVRRALLSVSLPPLYATIRAFGPGLERLQEALLGGARLVRLTAEGMSPDQRVILARRAKALADRFGARILLAGTALEARRADVDGVHSTAEALNALTARPHTPIWAVTCHTRADLDRAIRLGADFAVLCKGAGAADPRAAPIPLYAESPGEDVARRVAPTTGQP